MHFLGGPQNLDFLDMQKKKTCGIKYTSLSKFLHRSTYFSLYTRSCRKKSWKIFPVQLHLSGAKSGKTWRNMQISDFFIETYPQILISMISKGHVLIKILKSIPYPNTLIFFRGQILANFEEICKKEDFLNLKCVYWNPTTEVIVSIVYLCENLWCTEKKYPCQNAFFSGAKSCKIWRKRVKKVIFGLICIYRNSCHRQVTRSYRNGI